MSKTVNVYFPGHQIEITEQAVYPTCYVLLLQAANVLHALTSKNCGKMSQLTLQNHADRAFAWLLDTQVKTVS